MRRVPSQSYGASPATCRKFQRAKVPGNESSRERKFHGTFVPGSESYLERKFQHSDHTSLPATRHKWTRPALTPASKLVLDLLTPEGWKAELTLATRQCTGRESNSRSLDHKSNALTTRPYTTEPPRSWYFIHFKVSIHQLKRNYTHKQESPAVADKPARRLRKVCTVYVRAVGL